jgi:hypothetical protein
MKSQNRLTIILTHGTGKEVSKTKTSKLDSEIKDPELLSEQGSECRSCHAELVSASYLGFGFDWTF